MTGYQSIPYPARATDADSFTPDADLLLPGSRPRFQNFVIAGGQSLAKGSVLGMVTATRKLKLCTAAAGDGSQTPIGVLGTELNTFDIDGVTALDETFDVIVGGVVADPNALVLGAGMVITAVEDALRPLGFQFRTPGYSGSPV